MIAKLTRFISNPAISRAVAKVAALDRATKKERRGRRAATILCPNRLARANYVLLSRSGLASFAPRPIRRRLVFLDLRALLGFRQCAVVLCDRHVTLPNSVRGARRA
jgi:hypothetical protein